jgi:FMN phosphatase YigB (HAD superfamily)
MKTPILLTDLVGIWILKNDKGYENLLKKFCKEYDLNFEVLYKTREEFLSKYRKLVRVGKINYYEFEEKIFKQIDKKNYKKLAREYIKFEIKNCKMFLKLNKNAKNVLRELKRIGIKIIGITDAIKPNKLKKEELKILGILKYFDKIYSSHDLKCEKPEAFKHFKNLVDRAVFLGHDDDEILGAMSYGFLTIGLKNERANIMIKSLNQLAEILKRIKADYR